jgi:holo-[acyl-carrier protein] synthase
VPETFIGTDIVSVPRIKTYISAKMGERFIDKIFTTEEVKYCANKKNPFIHYAGRFAAKEAITKAILSTGLIDSIPMQSIEILSGNKRQPEVNLHMELNIKYKCKVSISHTKNNAVAVALLEIST